MSSHSGERALMSLPLLVRAPVLSNQRPILMTSLNKRHLCISNTVTWGLGPHTWIGGGGGSPYQAPSFSCRTEGRKAKPHPLRNSAVSLSCKRMPVSTPWVGKFSQVTKICLGFHLSQVAWNPLKEVIDALWFTAPLSFEWCSDNQHDCSKRLC